MDFLPGQIVVYSRTPLAHRFDASYLSAFGDLVVSRGFKLPIGERYLELFVVNAGEELRFLSFAQSQPGVISASLNYVGTGLAENSDTELRHPIEFFQPGVEVKRDTKCFFMRGEENAVIEIIDPTELQRELRQKNVSGFAKMIAVVDVRPDHCHNVMNRLAEGYGSINDDWPSIIALTANVDGSNLQDLSGFADRLLTLANIIGPDDMKSEVTSISMSVDFTHVVRHKGDQIDAAEGKSTDSNYSSHFCEAVLIDVVRSLSKPSDIVQKQNESDVV